MWLGNCCQGTWFLQWPNMWNVMAQYQIGKILIMLKKLQWQVGVHGECSIEIHWIFFIFFSVVDEMFYLKYVAKLFFLGNFWWFGSSNFIILKSTFAGVDKFIKKYQNLTIGVTRYEEKKMIYKFQNTLWRIKTQKMLLKGVEWGCVRNI